MAFGTDPYDDSSLNPLSDGLAKTTFVKFRPFANFSLRCLSIAHVVSQHLSGTPSSRRDDFVKYVRRKRGTAHRGENAF